MHRTIPFGRRLIGQGQPVYIIAEIGVNHEGNVDICAKMIKEAAKSGADAIKLQTCPPDENYIRGTESHILFSSCQLTAEETAQMFDLSRDLKMDPFTTSPDPKTLEWVDRLNPAGHKISSGMFTNPIIIRETCKTGRTVLMSTGLAGEDDIDDAVSWVKEAGAFDRFGLFHCTSIYPAAPEHMNLWQIQTLAQKFEIPVGLSDHSKGIEAAMLSVATGACMIEKHFTLDVDRESYDHRLSLDPKGFKKMVDAVRLTETFMGDPVIGISEELQVNRQKFLRSICARKFIAAGDILTAENIALKRPLPDKRGLDAARYDDVIGQIALHDLNLDDPITQQDISPNVG